MSRDLHFAGGVLLESVDLAELHLGFLGGTTTSR